jgi:hypothetical protein
VGGAGKKVAVSAAALLLALLGAEVAARLASRHEFTPRAARADAARMIDRLTGDPWSPAPGATASDAAADEPEYRIHPYFGFDLGFADELRAAELARPGSADPGVFDVMILGGSVAALLSNSCGEQIEAALEGDPAWAGWRVNVSKHAQGGFRQPQQLHLLLYLLSIGFEPEVVVELDGFNEVALGAANAREGIHPAMPWVHCWAPAATHEPLSPAVLDHVAAIRREQVASAELFETANSLGLFHSAVAAYFVQTSIERSYRRYARACGAYADYLATPAARSFCVGPPPPGESEAIELSARIWAESSLDMDALCRRRSIRYVHVLQPTLHDEGSKPMTEEERVQGARPEEWARAAREGYPLLRRLGGELARRGVEFLDASPIFRDAEETLYVDVCHLDPEGNRRLAQALIEQLRTVAPPALPEPARR